MMAQMFLNWLRHGWKSLPPLIAHVQKKQDKIQDERETEKFYDFGEICKNEAYRRIFQQEVRIKCQNLPQRKFMRFYFKKIKRSQLDFHRTSPAFAQHKQNFKVERFPFQVFMMNFSNSKNLKEFNRSEDIQEVGVITCFESKYVKEAFQKYEDSFGENSAEKFTLKLEDDCLMLNKAEYETLKRAHDFIVAASLDREIYHYSKLTEKKPFIISWISQLDKANFITEDPQREYYPIMVILKKKNGKYIIDQACLKDLEQHEKVFKAVYELQNYSGKQLTNRKFPLSLKNEAKTLHSQLMTKNFDEPLLVQSLDREHCFFKYIISGKETLVEDTMEKEAEKKILAKRNKKLFEMFDHVPESVNDIVRIVYWAKYKKEKKKEIFERDGKLGIREVENSKSYLPAQFCVYPLTSALLFKCCLATQFLFKTVFDYTLAFQFRNHKLPSIFKQKMKQTKNKFEPPFKLATYPNMILENGRSIFSYLANKSSSQHLQCIGNSYKNETNFIIPKSEFSQSQINKSADESATMENKQSETNSTNVSNLGLSMLYGSVQNSSFHKSIIQNQDHDEKILHLVSEIKVTEILKVLTSRMYKFNKVGNYEEYEFIGDVVLKMLSTVQVFLEKPQADENQLNLMREDIISNANLHRKSISKNLYQYILFERLDQLAPPLKYASIEGINESYYEKTNFKLYNKNSEIDGFQYIPGKVHADIVEGLIGAFYLHSRQLNDCQLLLYFLDILKKPLLKVDFIINEHSHTNYNLPKIYANFEQRINYKFKNKGHLIQAFTHSSFADIINMKIVQNANRDLKNQQSFLSADRKTINKDVTKALPWEIFYERYEFLGDSILELIVVEYLLEKYGTKDEGTLTTLKRAAVNNKALGLIALRYGMHELILMNYSNNDQVMREFWKILDNYNFFLNNPEALIDSGLASVKILGDVLEALVGAIFVDLQLDYQGTKKVILPIIEDFVIHYTNLETKKKSSIFKFQSW